MCVCCKNGPVDAVSCSANGFTYSTFSRTGSLKHRLRNLFQGTREMDLLLDWSNHLLNSSELHTHTQIWVRKSKITLHQIEFKCMRVISKQNIVVVPGLIFPLLESTVGLLMYIRG